MVDTILASLGVAEVLSLQVGPNQVLGNCVRDLFNVKEHSVNFLLLFVVLFKYLFEYKQDPSDHLDFELL